MATSEVCRVGRTTSATRISRKMEARTIAPCLDGLSFSWPGCTHIQVLKFVPQVKLQPLTERLFGTIELRVHCLCMTSLYNVKSSTSARDSLYKTINKSVWLLAIMKRENQFAVQGHTTFTPALISMDELSLLIEFLQSAKSYAGKRKVQLQENMKFLFTTHV